MAHSEYETGNQPCDDFTPIDEEWFGPVQHVCPKCEGLRMFCGNCCKDHHKDGWETCNRVG